MSCSSQSTSTPWPRTSLERGLSSALNPSVSPGSASLSRNFPPFVTRNFPAILRACLMSFLGFMFCLYVSLGVDRCDFGCNLRRLDLDGARLGTLGRKSHRLNGGVGGRLARSGHRHHQF